MMLDDATTELLSRHMDGDLAASEEQQLKQLLAEQPALQQELSAMLELRDAVRAFADQEEPPAELSALLEPLRRSPPPPVTVRPFYRWLAAAAVLCLGVTVTLEMVRQNPEPRVPSPNVQLEGPGSREPFRLHPLPTPKDQELVGAIDHLLANPPPEEQLESPPPLEVMGPIEQPPDEEEMPAGEGFAVVPEPEAESEAAAGPQPGSPPAPLPLQAERSEERSPAEALRDEPTAAAADEAAPARTLSAKSHAGADHGVALRESAVRGRVAADCVIVLLLGGQLLELPCEPDERPAPGSYPVEVTIRDGRISRLELLPVGARDTEASLLSRAVSRFAGSAVADLGDGRYTSRVAVR